MTCLARSAPAGWESTRPTRRFVRPELLRNMMPSTTRRNSWSCCDAQDPALQPRNAGSCVVDAVCRSLRRSALAVRCCVGTTVELRAHTADSGLLVKMCT